MSANAFINRFEIILYSSLTSVMSGINHLRSKFGDVSSIPDQASVNTEFGQILLDDKPQKRPFALTWETFKAVLPALFLWIVLGFAAGFLIGMLTPG